MKDVYDKKTKASNILPGDWVLIKDETRQNTLEPMFTGPWLVVERFGVDVHLNDPSSERSQIVHLNRCKPSSTEINESQLGIYPQSSDSPGEPNEIDDEIILSRNSQCHQEDVTELRRSGRLRRDPDRYGDMEVYWHNRGSLRNQDDKEEL